MMIKIDILGLHSGELVQSLLLQLAGERIEEGFVNLLRYFILKYAPYAAIIRRK